MRQSAERLDEECQHRAELTAALASAESRRTLGLVNCAQINDVHTDARLRGRQRAFTPRAGLYLARQAGTGQTRIILGITTVLLSLAHFTADATRYVPACSTEHPSLHSLSIRQHLHLAHSTGRRGENNIRTTQAIVARLVKHTLPSFH